VNGHLAHLDALLDKTITFEPTFSVENGTEARKFSSALSESTSGAQEP
jgi:hypothetical protein